MKYIYGLCFIDDEDSVAKITNFQAPSGNDLTNIRGIKDAGPLHGDQGTFSRLKIKGVRIDIVDPKV